MGEKIDKRDTGVDDRIERYGEMVLAIIGVIYSIVGRKLDMIDGITSFRMLVISFGFYQGTTVFKYIRDIFISRNSY